MKKITIIALILLAVGMALAGIGFAFMKLDISALNTLETYTKTYYESADVTNISIKGESSKVILIPYEEDECKIVCTEAERITHEIEAKDGTLYIEKHDTRRWYEHIGVFIGDMTIEVYLPETEYNKLTVENSSGSVVVPEGFFFNEADIENSSGGVEFRASADRVCVDVSSGSIKINGVSAADMKLRSSSGSIKVDGTECEEMDISASSGAVKLSDVECTNVTAECSSGSVALTNVIAAGKMKAKTSSGSVKLSGSDAYEIEIRTSSGSVSGTLLTDKMFDARSGSGSVKVPASVADSGFCVIETSSGSIKISIGE